LLLFYQDVSPSKELRDASNSAEALAREYAVASSMRVDVYKSKVAAEKNAKSSGEWEKLSPEAQLLVEKMLLDGKRDGLDLPEEKRKELEILQKELQQACLDFSKNFNEENVRLAIG
jgi:Zn-dependent oligopeptidase